MDIDVNALRLKVWDKDLKIMINQYELGIVIKDFLEQQEQACGRYVLIRGSGVCDSKGREVYETDIFCRNNHIYTTHFGVVMLFNLTWVNGFYFKRDGQAAMSVAPEICSSGTIIGNILQNPELVEG